MGVNALHTLYAIDIDGTLIEEVSSQAINLNNQRRTLSGDGQVDPTFSYVSRGMPTYEFNCKDLKVFLDLCGINGYLITSAANLFFQACDPGGTRKTGSNHIKHTAADGFLVPQSITVGEEEAELSAILHCTSSDGLTHPISSSNSAALTGTPAGTQDVWTNGPHSYNGTTINGVQQTTITFGIEVGFGPKVDGEPYPRDTAPYIKARNPEITFSAVDAALLNTFGPVGTVQSVTDSTIFFRKAVKGGTVAAESATNSIQFTFDDGVIEVLSATGSHPDEMVVSCKYTPLWDLSANIIVIDTAAAISLA